MRSRHVLALVFAAAQAAAQRGADPRTDAAAEPRAQADAATDSATRADAATDQQFAGLRARVGALERALEAKDQAAAREREELRANLEGLQRQVEEMTDFLHAQQLAREQRQRWLGEAVLELGHAGDALAMGSIPPAQDSIERARSLAARAHKSAVDSQAAGEAAWIAGAQGWIGEAARALAQKDPYTAKYFLAGAQRAALLAQQAAQVADRPPAP